MSRYAKFNLLSTKKVIFLHISVKYLLLCVYLQGLTKIGLESKYSKEQILSRMIKVLNLVLKMANLICGCILAFTVCSKEAIFPPAGR